eukprot:TRINITY_DN36411_c0_g1_i1.p1 TRINITY_DN36411_c0_g1~~TRINITY_DN36411_c0_g1_i1.p1  ORF type:complete len:345 (-),score=46.00 TRINITY_DN36411_c0_g1_i1:449-1483(-)
MGPRDRSRGRRRDRSRSESDDDDERLRIKVEDFIDNNQLDAKTASTLLACEPAVQRAVLSRGSLSDARDRNKVVHGRIRDASAPVLRPRSPTPDDIPEKSKKHRRRIRDFVEKNNLDDRVLDMMRRMHPTDADTVMLHPLTPDIHTPCGFVVALIRKTEQEAGHNGFRWDGTTWDRSPSVKRKKRRSSGRGQRREIDRSRARRSLSPSYRRSRSRSLRDVRERKPLLDEEAVAGRQTRESASAFFDGSTAPELLLDATSVIRAPDEFVPELLNGFPHGFQDLSLEDAARLLDVFSSFISAQGGEGVKAAEVRQAIVVTGSGKRLLRKSLVINGERCCSVEEPCA